jgi:hypothetical protein
MVIFTPGFGDIITKDRWGLVRKFLHFVNNEIIPIISHLNNKFQEPCLPNWNISVDESLILWKGHLALKEYLPLKASKFGIKTYELCDAITEYLRSFLLFACKDTELVSP